MTIWLGMTAFEPVEVGGLVLPNRIAMSPMTRNRAPGRIPNEQMAEYYAQRAGAGLIITEGTQPTAVGQGYLDTPGLHSADQIEGWRKVTDAVHAAGGRIFVQLMHSGRVGHHTFVPPGTRHVAPSPIRADAKIFTADGLQDMTEPEELDEAGIAEAIGGFVQAARNAIEAGFDGVEIHAANGYLLHQFLSSNANQRADRWGGPVENRIRLVVAVTKAVAEAIGGHRAGIRISPGVPSNDIREDDPDEVYPALVQALNPLHLAYLHIFEGPYRDLTSRLREEFDGPLILNPRTPDGLTGEQHLALLDEGTADLLTFGRLFLANPDLVTRLAKGGPYNTPDPATFYGGDRRGYTDYPQLAAGA